MTHDSITSSRALIRLQERFSEADVLGVITEEIAHLQSQVAQLQTEIKVMRATTAVRDLLLPNAAKDSRYVRSLSIRPSIPLGAAQGFYHLEYDDRGKPYRWTGPGNDFFMDLALDRTMPLRFTLRILGGTYNPSLAKLICTTDMVEIPMHMSEAQGVVSFEGVLLPRDVLGITRIRFHVPEIFEPAGPDPRRLGVLFLGLHIDIEKRRIENLINEQDVFLINAPPIIKALKPAKQVDKQVEESDLDASVTAAPERLAEAEPEHAEPEETEPKMASPIPGRNPPAEKI